MQANNAVTRIWGALSTLDSDITKSLRLPAGSAYVEKYPLPLHERIYGRPAYEMQLPAAADGRFEIIYFPSSEGGCERMFLMGDAAGDTIELMYNTPSGSWHEFDGASGQWPPVGPARVCTILRYYATTVERSFGRPPFSAEILVAVSELPPPIAEQVAWHLVPPSLEDSLLRRGLTSP